VSKPYLIGISGRARSGKDTLAWLLVDALRPLGIDARRYGWADALKAVCRVEYGMVFKDAPLLQRVGVDYRNGCRANCSEVPVYEGAHGHYPTPDIWVNTLLDTIAEDAPDIAIISDTRFPNELAAIKAAGGMTVRIERPDRPDTGRDDTHISETALDSANFDYIVENYGTRDDLKVYARRHATRILQAWEAR
jgi:hypothetical protein